MAEEVMELVARLRPEGAAETTDALQGAREEFMETADVAQDSSEDLEAFSERFQGALGVAVTALAVASAGILAQIPILGEAAAGLGAILESIGLQIDQLLRDLGAGGLVEGLFEFSAALDSLEGTAGDLVGVIGGLAVVVSGFAAIAFSAGAATGGLAAGATAVTSAFTAAGAAISGVVGSITAFITGSVAAAAAFGGLLGLLGVAALEVTGVLGAVRNLGSALADRLPAWARDGLLAVVGIFTSGFAILGAAITGFVQGFLDGGLAEGIDRAVANAQQALAIFRGAWQRTFNRILALVGPFIQSFIQALVTGLNQAIGRIESFVNKAVAAINRVIRATNKISGSNIGTIGNVSLGRIAAGSGVSAGRIGGGGGGESNEELVSVLRDLRNQGSRNPTIEIDGRRFGRVTSQFGGVETANRGR